MNVPQGLSLKDLPQVFHAADLQRRTPDLMAQTGARLIAAVIAAAAGVATIRLGKSHTDWAAIISCAAFLLALLLDVSLLRSRPEREWYDGRALAESAKTLAWKWAVCGNPYARRDSGPDPALLLADDLRKLRASAGDAALVPVVGTVVSEAMRRLRTASLDDVGRRTSLIAWRISCAGIRPRLPRAVMPRGAGGPSFESWRAQVASLVSSRQPVSSISPIDAVIASARSCRRVA